MLLAPTRVLPGNFPSALRCFFFGVDTTVSSPFFPLPNGKNSPSSFSSYSGFFFSLLFEGGLPLEREWRRFSVTPLPQQFLISQMVKLGKYGCYLVFFSFHYPGPLCPWHTPHMLASLFSPCQSSPLPPLPPQK